MRKVEKESAVKQKAETATKKIAATNVPPRQATRTPITPSAQTTAKPPAKPPAVTQPKPLSTLMSTTALDGFSGFVQEVEGDDRPQSGSVIQGTLIKFTSEAEWVTGAGDEMSRERELIAIELLRIAQKWIDQKPVETIIVPPGQKFPNIAAMNEKAPKSEWRENMNGEMVGPWQAQYILYLLDARSLDKFTFPTSTIGGGIAMRLLADKVAWMRKRYPDACMVVTLGDAFMNTKWGGRQRPHFNFVRWIGFGGGGAKALPGSKPPSEGGAAPQSETPPWKELKEPSLAEDMNDDLPDDLK
jgi:hypothetical protein